MRTSDVRTITLDDLTVPLDGFDANKLVEDWRWLIGTGKTPILASAVGDLFLHDESDGSVYWLDAGMGEIEQIADDVDSFNMLLRDQEFAMKVLGAELISNLHKSRKYLDPGQVYSFSVIPALGGKYTVDNFGPTDMEVHFSLAGQMHEHIKSLPPGALIPGRSA